MQGLERCVKELQAKIMRFKKPLKACTKVQICTCRWAVRAIFGAACEDASREN